MTDLIQKAIDVVDREAENMNDFFAMTIASHIIDNYLKTDENAEKALNKNFKDCVKNIKDRARNQAQKNVAVIDDSTVFGWVKEFYEFTEVNDNKILDIMDFV